jgi:hypothetical protein
MQRRRGREAAARDEEPAGVGAEARRVVARPLERDRRHVERGGLQCQDDHAALDAERFGHLEDRRALPEEERDRRVVLGIGRPDDAWADEVDRGAQ